MSALVFDSSSLPSAVTGNISITGGAGEHIDHRLHGCTSMPTTADVHTHRFRHSSRAFPPLLLRPGQQRQHGDSEQDGGGQEINDLDAPGVAHHKARRHHELPAVEFQQHRAEKYVHHNIYHEVHHVSWAQMGTTSRSTTTD